MTRAPLAFTGQVEQPALAPQEVWRILSLSPAYGDFVRLVEGRLAAARDQYELSVANEGYRQRVLELRGLHQFLVSGDLQ